MVTPHAKQAYWRASHSPRPCMAPSRNQMRARAQGDGPQAAGLATDARELAPDASTSALADPLNNGPCGDLFGGTCWVPKALITGSLIVGASFPVLVYHFGSETAQRYMWVGTAMGVLWEAPLSTPGWRTEPGKLLRLLRPINLGMLLLWCLWDGIIFLVGWWLCQAGAAHAQQAMAPAAQLAVHFAWGQASSLVVEAIAASTGMWAYKPEGWNVSLLRLPNGKHLTLLPQLIWALASTAFWAVTLFV